ncbi:hypothetical protein EXS70_03915 [Candidatus Peribacteria bacterium]|nr:hypothetical protein [Candidatus Peribacteria bacterium]
MLRSRLSSWTVIVLLLVPLTASAARNTDGDFRFCMQQVMNNREQRLVDVTRNFHINWFNIIEERRQRLFDSWGIENDRDRQNVQRDIDKDMRNRLRDNDTNFRNDQKNITNDFRNDERSCRDQYNQRLRDVPVGNICTSSSQCRPPLGYCTTETGECRSACERNSDLCIQVCAGRCRLR